MSGPLNWLVASVGVGFQSGNGFEQGVFTQHGGSSFSPYSGPVSSILLDPDEDPEDDDVGDEDECDASSLEDPRTGASRLGAAPA